MSVVPRLTLDGGEIQHISTECTPPIQDVSITLSPEKIPSGVAPRRLAGFISPVDQYRGMVRQHDHLPMFFTVTRWVFAVSVFGSVIVNTPSLHSAVTLSSFTDTGSVMARANDPLRRSMR